MTSPPSDIHDKSEVVHRDPESLGLQADDETGSPFVEVINTHTENLSHNDDGPSEDPIPIPAAPQSESPALPGTRGELPPVILLRHRMGYSTVELTPHQRVTYTSEDLEEFLFYKEQKYGAVNVLGRFSELLRVVASFTVFCQVFSMTSTEWHLVRYAGSYQSIGLFVACQEHLLQQCSHRSSSIFAREVVNIATGSVVCTTSYAFARRYVGTMWALGILQLLSIFVTVVCSCRVASRPTRSLAIAIIKWLFLLCMLLGVVNTVLFHFYVSCDRQACAARNESAPVCITQYSWGYNLYIAGTVLSAVCWMMALCMCSYIQKIEMNARDQMRSERSRRQNNGMDAGTTRQNFVENASRRGSSMVQRNAASANWGGSGHPTCSMLSVDAPPPPLDPNGQHHASEDYMTAVELGVKIAGANDWVYDDKSDMYYSFDRNMFWDPLTTEYYNCALKSWQESSDISSYRYHHVPIG